MNTFYASHRLVLSIVSAAVLMITVDLSRIYVTILTIKNPRIKKEIAISDTALVWVIDAYLIP